MSLSNLPDQHKLKPNPLTNHRVEPLIRNNGIPNDAFPIVHPPFADMWAGISQADAAVLNIELTPEGVPIEPLPRMPIRRPRYLNDQIVSVSYARITPIERERYIKWRTKDYLGKRIGNWSPEAIADEKNFISRYPTVKDLP